MRVRDNDRPSENFNGISFDTRKRERERERKREGEKHTKYKRKNYKITKYLKQILVFWCFGSFQYV